MTADPVTHQALFPLPPSTGIEWNHLPGLSSLVTESKIEGEPIIKVGVDALAELASEAFHQVSHYLRTDHLRQLRSILDDPDASPNDRFVALISFAIPRLPQKVFCQCAKIRERQSYWQRKEGEFGLKVGTRLPWQKALERDMLRIISVFLNSRHFPCSRRKTHALIFLPKSIYTRPRATNTTFCLWRRGRVGKQDFLHQGTPSLLKEDLLIEYLDERIAALGTAACPPYHLAVVIGGTSAEANLKTVKLASQRYLDGLPTEGNEKGHAIRCPEMEAKILKLTQKRGIGAQFGGKYFCLDVRVIRLPRHGASLPIGIGVSCSADRQALGKITREGVFLEKLEANPARFLPDLPEDDSEAIGIDLNSGMKNALAELSKYPVRTRLSLSGPLIVARDLAHSKLRDRLNEGHGLPDYFKQYPIYYAGPAKTPEGYASGSFGPTTAGRMDAFVNKFQEAGGSLVMLAKEIVPKWSCRHARSTEDSILAASADPLLVLPKSASKKWRRLNLKNWEWRPFVKSRWRISPPLSLRMTKETIFSLAKTPYKISPS